MTARPIFLNSRRRPIYGAVALVLVAAMVMAAGCVLQRSNSQNQLLSKEKFVFLEYRFIETHKTISGVCHPIMASCAGSSLSRYTLDEKKKILNFSLSRNQEIPVNDSFIIFFGQNYSSNYNPCLQYVGGGLFLYSLPAYLYGEKGLMGNVTLESVTENGTISLRYNDLPIILNPGERWENIAHENKIMERADPKSNNNKQNNNLLLNNNGSMVIEEAPWPGCTNEITTAEIIYNAGVFDKKSITIQRR